MMFFHQLAKTRLLPLKRFGNKALIKGIATYWGIRSIDWILSHYLLYEISDGIDIEEIPKEYDDNHVFQLFRVIAIQCYGIKIN